MSVDIADQCGFRLEMVTMPLPETEVPSDFKNADQYLSTPFLKVRSVVGQLMLPLIIMHKLKENYR